LRLQIGRDGSGECVEPSKPVAAARDEARTAMLDIEHAAVAVALQLEEPVGMIKRLAATPKRERLDGRER